MNHDTDRPAAREQRQPSYWISEGLVVLAIVLVALSALIRPPSEPPPLPDFDEFERADVLKQAFFDYLAPIVRTENERVLEQRRRLLQIAPRVADDRALPPIDRRWMRRLAGEYELDWPGESREDTLEELIERVDVVPPALALVQAAKESGWGRSRFAREGNNLFGQWCYTPGCGIVPGQRLSGAAHEVAAFDSVRESVRRYLNNLNTHDSYRPLRRIRAASRESGRPPRALSLADGLIRYSERREAYVAEIKQIIRANRDLIAQAAAGEPAAGAAGAGDR